MGNPKRTLLKNLARVDGWLPQTSLGNNLPLAVIADVDTTPATYYVVADHLNRPTEMFDQIKSQVWQAVWLPYGAPHSITGSLTQNLRFPGQFFQIESGLHYNWHRHYDPTLGRYTQGDPLGFVDGPSVYAYAKNNPVMYTDPDGRFVPLIVGAVIGAGLEYLTNPCASAGDLLTAGLLGSVGGGIGSAAGR